MSSAIPQPDVLAGVLERIIYRNDENGYVVAELRPDRGGKLVTVTGNLPGVQVGETISAEGRWTRHREHGDQYEISSYTTTLPSSVHGIRRYLGSGMIDGIGPVYADKIVDHFGADTLRILSEESARLREVPGIGRKRVESIRLAWAKQQAAREIYVMLQTYGITQGQCQRLLKKYGNDAPRIVKEEPYKLARDIGGIGFRTADRIARNLGFADDSPARLAAGLLHALDTLHDEGHTAARPEEIVERAAKALGVSESYLQPHLDRLLQESALVEASQPPLLQGPGPNKLESRLAAAVRNLMVAPSLLPPIQVDKAITWAEKRAGFELAPSQREALAGALTAKVGIITGGPGTGKTTILRALVDILQVKKVRVRLASPTGRAAQRLSESAKGPAQTLHRLLEYDAGTHRFSHDEEHSLQAKYVIVDEAGMLDTWLATCLLRALPPRCHLLLVGDADQLPSVGPGQVLLDLIQSGVPRVFRLTEIYRQGEDSGIVALAHDIRNGKAQPPALTTHSSEIDGERDVLFVPAPEPDACLQRTVEVAANFIPKRYGLDPYSDLQVLVPMHKGAAGVESLNQALQETLNPGAPAIKVGPVFYAKGDKVIQIRNDYDRGLFNGDLGRVAAINPATGTLAVRFGERTFDLERGELMQIQPAYAMTVHKAQGSEFPAVVIPLVRQHFLLLRRNLIYTAVTRAKRLVCFVGDPAAFSMAVRNTDDMTRLTDLRGKLVKEVNESQRATSVLS